MAQADPETVPITKLVMIANRRGLHARAAAKFVKTAGTFKADINVTKGGTTVSGSSIMGLMMLAAAAGCEIEITALGTDAEAALSALQKLVKDRFDED